MGFELDILNWILILTWFKSVDEYMELDLH